MRSSCVVSNPLLLPLVPTPPQPTFFPPLKATTVRVRHFTFNVYFFVCGKDRTLPVSWDGALSGTGALKRVKAFCQNPGTRPGTGQSFCQNSGTGLCKGSELFAKILGRGFATGQSFLPESREWVRSIFCFIHMYVFLEIQPIIRLERTTVCRCWYYLLTVAVRCIKCACCSEFFRLSMSMYTAPRCAFCICMGLLSSLQHTVWCDCRLVKCETAIWI